MEEPPERERRAAGGVGVGVFAILIGIGAVVVASQTQVTLTKALTGSFYLKDAYRITLQYCGFALILLGVLLTVLGSITNTEKAAIDTLRVVTTGLALTVLVGGLFVVAAYIHTKDLQAQNSTTTDTTTTDVTMTTDTTTASPVTFQVFCALDRTGHPTAQCINPDGTSAPAPGQDPATAHCTDQGRGADRAVEIYSCTPLGSAAP